MLSQFLFIEISHYRIPYSKGEIDDADLKGTWNLETTISPKNGSPDIRHFGI